MALQDQLKKINITGKDCKGIYLKDTDNIFSKKELEKKDIKAFDYKHIGIVLKFYFRRKTIKKTLKYFNITALQAVDKSILERNRLKEELEETGVIKKKDFKSLNDFFNDYIKLKSHSLSKENIYSTTKTYDKWIKNTIGEMAIDKINVTDIQYIVNDMLSQGLAPRTSQSIKQILRPIFNHAINLDLLIKNPTLKVNIPKFDNVVKFELSNIQRQNLFNDIWNYEHLKYRGIMLFLFMGRRLNEVLTLEWKDIIFNEDLNIYVIQADKSKDRKRHEYPLSEPLKIFLKEYGIKKRGYLFEGVKTTHVTDNTFRNHWENLIKKTDIGKMRIHDTRHLLGNTLINKGVTEDIIGKVLGHQSYTITSRYAKVHIDTINEALNIYLEDLKYL